MHHLPCGRKVKRLLPGLQRTVNACAWWCIKLPHCMAAVGYPGSACKDRKIGCSPDVVGIAMAKFFGIETNRVVFIDRLTVHHRFCRCEMIIMPNLLPYFHVTAMAGLQHVEVEPGLVMKPWR